MKLHKLKISGFKRLENVEISFGDATFLIGLNNAGKSSALKAIDYLLSGQKQISSSEYTSIIDSETGETKVAVDEIVFEAEFRNLPQEAHDWRGFKGRIFSYETENETGLSVFYKKTYKLGSDVIVQFKSKKKELNPAYKNCKTIQDYIDNGIDKGVLIDLFPDTDLDKNLGKSKPVLKCLAELDDIWDILDDEEWFTNPGGIPGVVLKMLPRYLIIPADTSISEINGKTGVLQKTLGELFEDVRESSENYKQAQVFLDALSKELDPSDEESDFGKMMISLNSVLDNVFPESKLYATTDLSDPTKVIKPEFNVEMSSNIKTSVDHQGSGMVRAAAFGMLRFRQKWLAERKEETHRSLIICFEEPEIYLHPSAANQMRDTIYELSTENSQIVSTTHSPFIIDISRKPRQILNTLSKAEEKVTCFPFNVTDKYKALEKNDKSHVKMMLKFDDHIARVFFAEKVVVVEGDTEEIAIKESLKKLPKKDYLDIISKFEILRARGKGTIISIIKYLTALGISHKVIHDRDSGIPGAEKFNKPIRVALNNDENLFVMCENIEDELGYKAPSSEKPLRAFEKINSYSSFDDFPENWKSLIRRVFEI